MKTKILKVGYSLIKTGKGWNLTLFYPSGRKTSSKCLYKGDARPIIKAFMKLISKGLENG